MKDIALVFLGGGIGSALRMGTYRLTASLLPGAFPWGTLIVNLIGSAAIGLLWGLWAGRGELPATASLFLMTGVLGGFTTFSAFSLDVLLLWQKGQMGLALAYVAASTILSIAAASAGFSATRLLS